MEPTTDPLDRLFAAWRAEIDSAPYAHEEECEKIVLTLLNAPRTAPEPPSRSASPLS
jgi:hypothetical protein